MSTTSYYIEIHEVLSEREVIFRYVDTTTGEETFYRRDKWLGGKYWYKLSSLSEAGKWKPVTNQAERKFLSKATRRITLPPS